LTLQLFKVLRLIERKDLSRPTFWSNLWYNVIEECDGLRHRVLYLLRKSFIKRESKAERANRLEEWKQIRKDILQRSQSDLWGGSRPEATDLQRSFFLHLTSEATRLRTVGSAVMMHNSAQGLDSHIGGWAAHFLPVEEFENLYVASVSLNVGSSARAMMYAWRSVAHFRNFPRLVDHQTKRLSEKYLGGVEDVQVRTDALTETCATITPHIDNDFEKGQKASAAFHKDEIGYFEALAHRLYFEFVEAETRRAKTELKDEKRREQYLEEVKMHGWATHFLGDRGGLGYSDYKAFYARTIIANRQVEVLAARRALHAARYLPAFPNYEDQFDFCARPRSL
jgi:hypothetical protein